MIKRARCRLRQLKNKRQVEQLIQDESLVATYESLDHLFVFILEKLSYIRRHKYDLQPT
ncbi:hypothetical protein E2542_SST09768 [Spatholobus suberectus]|nr:hypothetical protein E2542_SST09768 [Spatholobus suberectus]